MPDTSHLHLDNQLCFPLYAASREITGMYQPFLQKIGLTYPQYLILLVLWERDGRSVMEIAGELHLNSNTVTPLLKRMEAAGILRRERSAEDERRVMVQLSEKGRELRQQATSIPFSLAEKLGERLSIEEMQALKRILPKIFQGDEPA